mmetsp:Transcript_58773/g.102850  ORF Transcript_58773/g.102850 Transcript_58773/m.102850 type:complete len:210 (+) Transcript_58773:61-690(+)
MEVVKMQPFIVTVKNTFIHVVFPEVREEEQDSASYDDSLQFMLAPPLGNPAVKDLAAGLSTELNAEGAAGAGVQRMPNEPDMECEKSALRQSRRRPFLSLLLPNWVYERADDSTCSTPKSLLSFPSSSPTPSDTDPDSPEVASLIQRRGMCWADLEESEIDPVEYVWSLSTESTPDPPATARSLGGASARDKRCRVQVKNQPLTPRVNV